MNVSLKNKIIVQLRVLGYFCAIAVALVFVKIIFSYVFSDGLGYADDAYLAVVAKNIAYGYGYCSSVPIGYGPLHADAVLQYYSHYISTGPCLILPAALSVYIFGNTFWAPGFATATLSLVLMLINFVRLRHASTLAGATLCAFLMMILLYFSTERNSFANWFCLLGEIPAGLMCVLGAIVFASMPCETRTVVLSSLVFGLAATTKLLAALSFLPIPLLVLVQRWTRTPSWRCVLKHLMLAGSAFLLPLVCFEILKVVSLGFKLYVQHLQDMCTFIISRVNSKGNATFITTFSDQAAVLQSKFNLSVVELIIMAAVIGSAILRFSKSHFPRYLFFVLLTGAVIHITWWLSVPNAYHRYILIGLLLYFSALSVIALVRLPMTLKYGYSILLVLFFVRGQDEGFYTRLLERVNHKPIECSRLANLRLVANKLEELKSDQPFIAHWWATVADIEYALPTVGNFISNRCVSLDSPGAPSILPRNRIWTRYTKIADYTALEGQFHTVILDAEPYLITSKP